MAKPKKLMGVQQNQLHCDVETQAILTYLCEESNNLYNCGVYWARQIFFKTSRIVSKYDPIYADCWTPHTGKSGWLEYQHHSAIGFAERPSASLVLP